MHLKRSTTTGFRVRMLHMLFVTTRPLLGQQNWVLSRYERLQVAKDISIPSSVPRILTIVRSDLPTASVFLQLCFFQLQRIW